MPCLGPGSISMLFKIKIRHGDSLTLIDKAVTAKQINKPMMDTALAVQRHYAARRGLAPDT